MENDCNHKNKKVVDSWNFDDQVYYECPDCGAGWRQEPETEEDARVADRIMEEDIVALGLRKEE